MAQIIVCSPDVIGTSRTSPVSKARENSMVTQLFICTN